MLRVPYSDLYEALKKAMQRLGIAEERGALCARLFAETTRDGVYTHGLNRFPRFAAMVRNGSVDVRAEATRTAGVGSLERWNGHRGVGNLNAFSAMQRAMELAREHGIGGVALANTNHWMRGGSWAVRDVLEQYSGEYARLGSDYACCGEQSAGHRCTSFRWRTRCPGYGDVAVFLRDSR